MLHAETQMSIVPHYQRACSALCTAAAGGRAALMQPLSNREQEHQKYILLVKFLDIDSAEEVVSLFEVELQKPRNLSAHESEECEHGQEGGVYATLLQSDTL